METRDLSGKMERKGILWQWRNMILHQQHCGIHPPTNKAVVNGHDGDDHGGGASGDGGGGGG